MISATGAGLALLVAWVLTRWLSTLLFGVTATDPFTFAAVPLALGLVAFFATYLAARRATRVDPVMALRAE